MKVCKGGSVNYQINTHKRDKLIIYDIYEYTVYAIKNQQI